MKDVPDIVKELREAERLGLLQSKMKLEYEERNQFQESSEDVLHEIASFVDNLQTSMHDTNREMGYNERIYRAIIEQNVVGVVVAVNSQIIFCNRKEAELFGYNTPSELMGRELYDFVHIEDIPRVQDVVRRLIENKTDAESVVFRAVHKKGKEVYIEAFSTAFPSEGKEVAILSFHIDVTGRMKGRELARNVERRYRLITENARDLIATTTFSLNPRYTYVSPSHEKLVGYKTEELMGKPVFDIIHQDDKKELLSLIRKYIKYKGKKVLTGDDIDIAETVEYRVIDKKGKEHFVESTVNILGDELLIVSRDITQRKRVEEHFRDLFDNANDLIQSVDASGRFIYVNKRWLKTLGYSEEEVKNLTVFDILRKDQIDHCSKIIERVSKGESFDSVETVFVAKDGREIFVEGSINGRFEDGRFVSTRAIFRDVTERKIMEEKYKRLFDASPDLIAEVDERGNFLVVNSAMAESIGIPAEKLIGKNAYDVLPKDVVERCMRFARKSLRENKICILEDERNGRYFHNIVVPIVYPDGRKSIQVIARDITEQKKAEEKLRESEARLRAFFDATDDMLIIVDENGVILDLNDAMAARFGKKKEDLIGRNMREYLPEDVFERRFALALEAVKTKKPVQFEDERDGRIFHSVYYPIIEENGEVHRIAAFIRDITEEKKIQIQLKESEERYRSVMETAADGIVIVDEGLRIVSWNRSATKIFGYKTEEILGKPLWNIIPERLKENFLKGIKKLSQINISDIVGRTIEVVGLRKDGREIPIEISFSVYEINGKRFFTSIIRDISERKRIEREIRESEEKYRTIFETSPEAIVLFDRDGHVIDLNNRVRKWLGYSKKDLMGKHIRDLPVLSERSKNIAIKKFSQRLKGKYTSVYELEFVTNKGKVVIGRISGTTIKDSDGNIVGTLVMISDITQQKQFEEELRESEEKFRTISSSAHDAIVMMDNEGRITYWNRAAEKMFGYKAEEIVGKHLHYTIAPRRYHKDYAKNFDKFRTTGKGAAVGKTLELSALRKDGTEFPVELSLSSVKIKGSWHAIGIIRDITARKKMEEKLMEVHREMETLLNAAADGIRIVNRDFTVKALNETMAELAGIDKKRAAGMKCSDMFGSNVCGTRDCSMVKILKNGKKIQTRMVRRRMDGTEIPCLYVATPLRDAKGKIVGIIEDFRDITEMERIENNLAKAHYRLRQQNEKLKRLNNLQKIFLNVTSHELRTPMAAIRGYAELLLLGTLGELTDEQKEALSVMRRNIDRLDNLIKDILDISRLQSGTLSIQPTNCDLLEIIAEVLATIKFTAETKNISIETKVDENMPPIYADRDRIKQVLINLLGNAIKFSDSGSKVILSAKRDKDSIIIAVKDFGRGIPKNKQKKIFEPFYQVDSGMDRKFGGVGLGLAITRGIVEAHDGEITVESRVGKGSTFYVRLPIKPSFVKKGKHFSIFREEKALPEISLKPSHSELERLIDEMTGNTKK